MIKIKRPLKKNMLPSRQLSGIRFILPALFFSFAIILSAGTGFADESDYDPKEAGHPIRIIAYVAHPVGVLIDYAILRPAYWLGEKEPFKTIFGQKAEFGQGSRQNKQTEE